MCFIIQKIPFQRISTVTNCQRLKILSLSLSRCPWGEFGVTEKLSSAQILCASRDIAGGLGGSREGLESKQWNTRLSLVWDIGRRWQESREGDSECRRTGCKRLAGGPQEHPLDNPGCFLAIFISRFDTSICAICTDKKLTSRAPVQNPRGTFGLLWGEGLLDRTEDPQCETHMLELHRSAGLASTWAGQADAASYLHTNI